MVTLILLLFLLVYNDASGTTHPIIGVIAQPFKTSGPPGVEASSFISASYVKFLEAAGARVVPIPAKISAYELERLVTRLNGVLLPGGNVDLAESSYKKLAEFFYNWATVEYDGGGYFPILGIGLGMQALATLATGTGRVVTPSEGTWDKSMRLVLASDSHKSKILGRAPTNVLETLEGQAVTYNVHYNCVSVETFTTTNESKSLQHFFRVVSTNTDANGKKFVSTFEAYDYPFYGVQWHPEMPMFEFNTKQEEGVNLNHSQDSIQAGQYIANFFVGESRKNDNSFPDLETENKYLIYNYKPVFAAEKGWFDEEIYVF